MNDLTQRAREIISKIIYITIATVTPDGKPWNSPVYSAFDENYNFYWGSDIKSQHSQNITSNENVFIVIYNSLGGDFEGEGVYIKAKAHEIVDVEEKRKAFELLNGRKEGYPWTLDILDGTKRQRLFKAVPEQCWMNGDSTINGNFIDIRTEINLK